MIPKQTLYTVGHSTLPLEKFIALLQAHSIEKIIDVRSIPFSAHNPQYNQDELKHALKKAKIYYRHLKELGGRRRPLKDSPNTGWKNASFRGFADYMATDSFKKGLEKLMKLAQDKRCALLCAEGMVWRCHRSLIADALTKKKWKVYHIQSRKTAKKHTVTPFLKVRKGALLYIN